MSNAAGLHSFPDDSSEPLSEETGRGKAAIEKDRVGREAHFKREKQQRETGAVRSMGNMIVKQRVILFFL